MTSDPDCDDMWHRSEVTGRNVFCHHHHPNILTKTGRFTTFLHDTMMIVWISQLVLLACWFDGQPQQTENLFPFPPEWWRNIITCITCINWPCFLSKLIQFGQNDWSSNTCFGEKRWILTFKMMLKPLTMIHGFLLTRWSQQVIRRGIPFLIYGDRKKMPE